MSFLNLTGIFNGAVWVDVLLFILAVNLLVSLIYHKKQTRQLVSSSVVPRDFQKVDRWASFALWAVLVLFVVYYALEILALIIVQKTMLLWIARLKFVIPLVILVVLLLTVLAMITQELDKPWLTKIIYVVGWILRIGALGLSAWVVWSPLFIKKVIIESGKTKAVTVVFGDGALWFVAGLAVVWSIALGLSLWFLRRSHRFKENIKLLVFGLIWFGIAGLFISILPLLGIRSYISLGTVISIIFLYAFFYALKSHGAYSLKYIITHQLLDVVGSLVYFLTFIPLMLWYKFSNIDIFHVEFFASALAASYIVNSSIIGIMITAEDFIVNLIYPKLKSLRDVLQDALSALQKDPKNRRQVLAHTLKTIQEFLSAEYVCVQDNAMMPSAPYRFCVPLRKAKTPDTQQDLIVTKITLSKDRFLIIAQRYQYIPQEFLDLLDKISSVLNTLINLDITFNTLDNVNATLVKAVASKTQKLNKQIKQLTRLKRQLLDIINQAVKHMEFAANMLAEYTGMIDTVKYNDPKMLLVKDKLTTYITQLKQSTQEIFIKTQVLLDKNIPLSRVDIIPILRELSTIYKPRFAARLIDLFPQLPSSAVVIKAYKPMLEYFLDQFFKTLVSTFSNGVINIRCYPQDDKAVLRFKIEANYSPKRIRQLDKGCHICNLILKKHGASLEKKVSGHTVIFEIHFPLAKA